MPYGDHSLNNDVRGHTAARFGGDEFLVLLDGIAAPGDAIVVAERLLDLFSRPYRLGEHEVYSTASIGIVTSDNIGDSDEDVLRDADTAMYAAKLAGRGRYAVFDASMRHRARNSLSLENDLRKALDGQQLFLMYQPIDHLPHQRPGRGMEQGVGAFIRRRRRVGRGRGRRFGGCDAGHDRHCRQTRPGARRHDGRPAPVEPHCNVPAHKPKLTDPRAHKKRHENAPRLKKALACSCLRLPGPKSWPRKPPAFKTAGLRRCIGHIRRNPSKILSPATGAKKTEAPKGLRCDGRMLLGEGSGLVQALAQLAQLFDQGRRDAGAELLVVFRDVLDLVLPALDIHGEQLLDVIGGDRRVRQIQRAGGGQEADRSSRSSFPQRISTVRWIIWSACKITSLKNCAPKSWSGPGSNLSPRVPCPSVKARPNGSSTSAFSSPNHHQPRLNIMSAAKLVAVFAENKCGRLAAMTQVIAEAGVNIRWVTIANSDTFGVTKFLVDQCDKACETLKQKGFTVSLIDVLAIEVADTPGGLHHVADVLARNKINVENSSGFVSNKRAVLVIEVRDIPGARVVLQQNNLHLLSQEEVLGL